jgi:hypothetical protein
MGLQSVLRFDTSKLFIAILFYVLFLNLMTLPEGVI